MRNKNNRQMADRKVLENRNENEIPIWKWNWGISDEKKVVCKTARRAHSQKKAFCSAGGRNMCKISDLLFVRACYLCRA